MGREVRRVPANWQHPKNEFGAFRPMYYSGFEERADEWDEENAKWNRGEFPKHADAEDKLLTYEQWGGDRPRKCDYMPAWTEAERTHFMMYEDTSEGTPISPAFATPEELARWLADTGASSFGSAKATYEQWLRVAQGGYAPSAVYTPDRGLQSGVEALTPA